MIIIYSTRLLRVLVPWFPGISGLTVFPFIILSKGLRGSAEAAITINHEKIHIRQQMELLLVFFAFWYLGACLFGIIRGLSLYEAYRDNIFEREAFDRMHDFDYLRRRKLFSFMNYRKKKNPETGA